MPVRDRLRAVTREAHERVDHRFSRYDLGDPEQYRGFLEAHHAVLPACERMLKASGDIHDDPDTAVASAIETFGLFEPATGLSRDPKSRPRRMETDTAAVRRWWTSRVATASRSAG